MDLYLYIRLLFNVQLTPNECGVLSHHEFELHSPGGSDSKESACNARDPSSILGSGRSPGKGNGSPLQCSCLGNPTDRGAWQATQSMGSQKGRMSYTRWV